mmetsp:Transcript_7474/g.10490  ORF Transcript_7474/g.10490 Transcript_7474/m.10490 type:complete len:512 (+) Transcript_7474:67-1602(+)|eukprot:CAMPEP_0171474454 /NCGR_PEP_ID=MMETSP0946-20130122/2435_1 /TAXON_ID=109269 /ORGANISM="Vaucheria litorea, Strain CCMP2940" /LENGTH=511 /DNA_ID=CAMNT_0012004389 /DNA_START=58 /DNA_END=1593 /DNA_ORIENTATION=+
MLALFETPAGYALFKVSDASKVEKCEDLIDEFETYNKASKMVNLIAFSAFEDTAAAVAAASDIVDGKLSKSLKKFLTKNIVKKSLNDKLAVCDSKLGSSIREKLDIKCLNDNGVMELMRGIRLQIDNLLTGIDDKSLKMMRLGLSHSLGRYKLKFTPDKVDTMVVQAIGLLDDLDKEINTYSMRVREWYGWHFPEMGKIITDNWIYAKCVMEIGTRENCHKTELSHIINDPIVESSLKENAEVSMGTEITESDLSTITELAEQVVELSNYRAQLYEYLKNRMAAIAPNLTILLGELVGARLIAHAGSLMNLAKHPSSTVQILGAEKALFRALKSKKETPKYGLIYHASLIGQSNPKNKGKISRSLAAKSALAIRYDALGDDSNTTIGLESRAKIEAKIRSLQGNVKSVVSKVQIKKYDSKVAMNQTDSKSGVPPIYNAKFDSVVTGVGEMDLDEKEAKKKMKKEKKEKKRKAMEIEGNDEPTTAVVAENAEESEKKSKKKKKKSKTEKVED